MITTHRGKLIPFQSTYFRCVETEKDKKGVERLYTARLTKGKVYPIFQWNKVYRQSTYSFKDEDGILQEWVDYWGIEDASYEILLKKVLE